MKSIHCRVFCEINPPSFLLPSQTSQRAGIFLLIIALSPSFPFRLAQEHPLRPRMDPPTLCSRRERLCFEFFSIVSQPSGRLSGTHKPSPSLFACGRPRRVFCYPSFFPPLMPNVFHRLCPPLCPFFWARKFVVSSRYAPPLLCKCTDIFPVGTPDPPPDACSRSPVFFRTSDFAHSSMLPPFFQTTLKGDTPQIVPPIPSQPFHPP